MSEKRSYGVSIGASSILIVIVILTMVCFAGLSLASANADYKLCRKLADRTSAYYDATSVAYTRLSEAASKKESSEDENSLNINIPINENQQLEVEALLHPSASENYEIKRFLIVTTSIPEIDNSLSLLLK